MKRHLSIAVCASLLLPLRAIADDTLIIELPPPVSTQSAQTIDSNTQKPGAASQPDRRGASFRDAKQYVVGRLGVTKARTTIRRGRGAWQRSLASVQAGTYLAITQDKGGWFGVLMSDRTTGWLQKTSVEVLSYEVVSNEEPGAASSQVQREAMFAGGQNALLQYSYRFLGIPYRYGGNTAGGIDCSAFVQQCFSAFGVRLPRTAREQFEYGMPVTTDQLQAADRLYFASRDGRISHTGIYIGNGYFIHSSSSRRGVAISRLTEPMYQRMFAGARR